MNKAEVGNYVFGGGYPQFSDAIIEYLRRWPSPWVWPRGLKHNVILGDWIIAGKVLGSIGKVVDLHWEAQMLSRKGDDQAREGAVNGTRWRRRRKGDCNQGSHRTRVVFRSSRAGSQFIMLYFGACGEAAQFSHFAGHSELSGLAPWSPTSPRASRLRCCGVIEGGTVDRTIRRVATVRQQLS